MLATEAMKPKAEPAPPQAQPAAASLTPAEVTALSGCIERVNAVVGATDGMDAMADSFGKVSACLERLITTAGTNTTGPGAQLLSRLAQSMQSAS